MPFTIAIAVGSLLIAWGVATHLRKPRAARRRDVELTGDVQTDLTLQAAIPTGSGVGLMLVGMVVVLTALATLVVA
ncbi:MAG TPA: hypothetical protein VJ978_08330 [Nitriliruptoraceae bacterium]|nr:hypothetical protein [Nitriliruptoraceae bacterium]